MLIEIYCDRNKELFKYKITKNSSKTSKFGAQKKLLDFKIFWTKKFCQNFD